jgi:tetratricopeptide (TPR) repeat protein
VSSLSSSDLLAADLALFRHFSTNGLLLLRSGRIFSSKIMIMPFDWNTCFLCLVTIALILCDFGIASRAARAADQKSTSTKASSTVPGSTKFSSTKASGTTSGAQGGAKGLSLLDQLRSSKQRFPPKFLDELIAKRTSTLSANPKDLEALKVRGFVYWSLHKFSLAQPDLEKAAEVQTGKPDAEVCRELGDCYLEDGFWAKALDRYNQAIHLLPDDKHLYFMRAQAYAALEKYPQAIEDANRVVANWPDQSWTYSFRAQLYNNAGKYQQSVADYTQALKREPNTPRLYDLRASSYEKLGKHELAEQDRKRVIELTKDEVNGFGLR